MQVIPTLDLRADDAAVAYVKVEVVEVTFAKHAGEIQSRVGPNRYGAGDALITGSTGDRWSVSRDRFDARYLPLAPLRTGDDGSYQAVSAPVLAKQMSNAFSIARSAGGDVLFGEAKDWLVQYAPGDYGVVERTRFAQVYRPCELTPFSGGAHTGHG